jgi:hypothetical protein
MHSLCTGDHCTALFVIVTTSHYARRPYLASVQMPVTIPSRALHAFFNSAIFVLSIINHCRSQTNPHFLLLHHDRPGVWLFSPISSSSARPSPDFDFSLCPFPHLLIVTAEPILLNSFYRRIVLRTQINCKIVYLLDFLNQSTQAVTTSLFR